MLSEITGYAIGMDAVLNDENAIQFTKDLFSHLAAGQRFEDAFAWSKAASELGRLAGGSVPRLFFQRSGGLSMRVNGCVLDFSKRLGLELVRDPQIYQLIVIPNAYVEQGVRGSRSSKPRIHGDLITFHS